jgi:ABC-2 type transport system permease protein
VGWSDFFLKYRGSFLGYLWSLLGPLAKFLVIYYVFRPLIGRSIAQYPLYLFLGVIIWEHFTVTTSHCMSMLYEKAAFIQKISFPRILLIFIVGWTNLIIFFTHFLIFAAFAIVLDAQWSWHWLYVPVGLLQMTLLALGVGMLLASFSLKFRDIPHLWGIFSQVLFWLTPIMYSYTMDVPISHQLARISEVLHSFSLHAVFDTFVQFQPLSILIYDMRRATLYGATQGMPSLLHILAMTVILGMIFFSGAAVFHRRSKYFLQEY